MAVDLSYKEEILQYVEQNIKDQKILENIKKEIEIFASAEDAFSKPCLLKIYNQWKSGKKGKKNLFNSYLGFALGISKTEPDKNLPFGFKRRRAFARPSPPDIDSDFVHLYKDKILNFLVKLYGRDYVGNIGTYNALKMKSALTRIIKTLDIANSYSKGSQAYKTDNEAKAKEIKNALPEQRGAVLKIRDENGEEHAIKNTKDAVKWCQDFAYYMEKHPEIVQHAENIEGLLSIYSVHASGVVLGDVPLSRIAPLRTCKENSDTVSLATQFAYEDLEKLGLIKFDILAISTLTVIAETLEMIKSNYGIKIDIERLPLDDEKTLELYRTGRLAGVFQCESYPMQKTCMEIGVNRFDDIMAAISLFRPGPMESIPEYCARKKGEKEISYFHPTIEPHVKHILSTTYGVLVYQEQVMKICESLGGMTKTEGLGVIKGISKKLPDVIEKGHKSFLKGATSKGVPSDVAEQYWEKFITPFALYGFNASHSCCYAYNSYITAYLKANYPEEFMCAYMNVETERRKMEKVAILEKECKNLNINISKRNINKCELKYQIIKKKNPAEGIYYSEINPSIMCKDLSHSAAASIVENRPYNSVIELAEKTSSAVDTGAVEALANAGFFAGKKDKLIKEFEVAREDMKKRRQHGDAGDNIL